MTEQKPTNQTKTNPHILTDDSTTDRAFWADVVADQIEERNPEEPIVIKGGISPSGVPHIGNMNEIMRGHFVAEALCDRGYEVRQVFTSDDRDPLRKVPRKLADLEGNVVDLGEVDAGVLGRNLGKPYTDIPDPFGCCDSYGDHFSALIKQGAEQLGVAINIVSNTELYKSGKFEDATRYVLGHTDKARAVLSKYQDKVDDNYIPFNPICEECGKINETVTAIDTEADTVDYICTDMRAGDNTISGCGHEGTATFREGKLPWRFEWPAQWQVLGVDFEPFGKDHAEGSWPSGEDIARNVFGNVPPLPMAYEWFTLNGKPLSSSAGNVILVSEVLELIEQEVLRYFFAKDPKKARDFAVSRLDQLVNEFDQFEANYYDRVREEDGDEFVDRVYPFVVSDQDSEPPLRIPYSFAAVLGMFDDVALREEVARKEGHIPENVSEAAVETCLARVKLARTWARRTDNEYNYEIKRAKLPDIDIDTDTKRALDELAEFIAEGHTGEEIQGEIYETAKRNDIPIQLFFTKGYQLFFQEEQGPKLGQFLSKLDQDFVVRRLRREK